MLNNNPEIPDLARAYLQLLEHAVARWPKSGQLYFAPTEESEDDMIPVPIGIIMLCSTLCSTVDDESRDALTKAMRRHFNAPLTDQQVVSLLQQAGDQEAMILASGGEVSLYLYPSGIVWAPVTNFAAFFKDGVWQVQAAGRATETTTTLLEMIKLITRYGREGLNPAALE